MPTCHSVRGGPQHLPQPSESEKTSQKRWQNQGIHFPRPKVTAPDPASGQALRALWGHPALLPNPAPMSSTPVASGCFLQGSPTLSLFGAGVPQGLASLQPLSTAHCPQAVLASPRCQPPIGISHIWSPRPEANSAARQLSYLMSTYPPQPPSSSHHAWQPFLPFLRVQRMVLQSTLPSEPDWG